MQIAIPNRDMLVNYFLGTLGKEEEEVIDAFLALHIELEYVDSCLVEAMDKMEITTFPNAFQKERVWNMLLQKMESHELPKRKLRQSWFRVLTGVAAAVILVAFSIICYTRMQSRDAVEADLKTIVGAPAGNKANLKLADGRAISLSDASAGNMIEHSGIRVLKNASGEMEIKIAEGKQTSQNAFHRISTPRGGRFKVVLPDGSLAWLNAESAIRFPENFMANQRRVNVSGEIYFEIAKVKNENQEAIPFVVESGRQEIRVLGTHFNVQAYPENQEIETTLIEGRVQVLSKTSGKSVILIPGQQAKVGQNIQVKEVINEEVLAWKNGDFFFQDDELQQVLTDISRWYDVDFECPERLKKIKISGIVSREKSLDSILKRLSSLGKAHLELKGRRIIVKE
ncbi:FecR family protein [Sphingobacterium lactis]|uniref:FecR protein n=1 Tax=Sphingobacterium lactis TaxID=797291 RepID=A0A1H6BX75_9SPHI|nr:FecR domain-containing protein [Sphingobacterium lactis]SEG65290.1 FecR protein [Sphingobacterium lactis]